jgi:hypothetical protein
VKPAKTASFQARNWNVPIGQTKAANNNFKRPGENEDLTSLFPENHHRPSPVFQKMPRTHEHQISIKINKRISIGKV